MKCPVYIPKGSRWTAGQKWRCLHCRRNLQQSARYSRGQWRWSRLPAAPHPGSTAPVSAERWRWQSDHWTLVPETHTHLGCGPWCGAGWARSEWVLQSPLSLGIPEEGRETGCERNKEEEQYTRRRDQVSAMSNNGWQSSSKHEQAAGRSYFSHDRDVAQQTAMFVRYQLANQ